MTSPRISSAGTTAVVVLVACLGCTACGGGGAARDVLVVTLDTTRADHLGCYGGDADTTPNLDRFAAQAVVFEQAVAPIPVTLPSHSTMFTGLNPYRHGVRYNLMYVLPGEQTTVAERLSEAGFRTGAVVSALVLSARFGLDQGFDRYLDIDRVVEGETIDDQPQRRARESIDHALDWWKANAGGRRFLWVHLYDPHYVYEPPFPFSSQYENRPYEGEIAYMDGEVGRLFEALRASGEWDETLVVVAGDHGESLYEHGERWHADLVYQGAMHPPLMVKPPGWTEAERIRQPVGLLDIAPTILDYTGGEPLEDAEGISLRESMRDGRAPLRPIYFESLASNLNYGWGALRGVRYGRHKYFEGGRAELYDLAEDPAEETNLVQRDPQRAVAMAAMLGEFRGRERDLAEAEATTHFGEEELQKMTALGYVGTSEATVSELEDAVHPPDRVELLSELIRAQGLVSRGEWEQAADTYDYILKRDPKNRSALHNRAWAYFNAGEMEAALHTAEVLWGIYPDSVLAPDLVARIHSHEGRPREAAEVLSRALERHPSNPTMRFHRVLAWLEAGAAETAEPDVAWLEENRPDHWSAALARAMLQAAGGDADAALASLRLAAERGLKRFDAVDGSPLFAAVRQEPGYEALKREVAEEASESK